MRFATLAAGVCAWALAAAADAAPREAPEPAVSYRVAAGDNLYTLGGRYLGRRSDYLTVQRLNRIRDPRRLPVGRTLTIPAALLRTEPVIGRLAAFRGAVSVTGPGSGGTIRREMEIREGDVLATGPNAFLTITLPDESRITLPSNSRVRVSRLRRVLLTGAVQRRFALEAGRSTSVVTPLRGTGSRYEVTTPLTVAAVRGTEFRSNFDPAAGAAVLEVLEGSVTSRDDRAETPVPAGFGLQTTAAGAATPGPLSPAPKAAPGALLQDEPQLVFPLEPVPGARAYRAQLAMDAGFIDVIGETQAQEPRPTFEALPNGTYFVRFTAVDATGLEGMPATYAFERRLNSLTLETPEAAGGRFLFRWRSEGEGRVVYRFVLTPKDQAAPVVDEAGLTEARLVVTRLPPGRYSWRVLATRFEAGNAHPKWSSPQEFEVGR